MSTEQRVLEAAAEARGCPANDLVHWQVDNPFFRRWTIWQVEMDALPPLPLFVAANEESAEVIQFEDGLAELTAVEPVSLQSPSDAVDYVRFFVQAAKPDADILESLDDVAGVPDDKMPIFQDVVTPPHGTQTDEGYRVRAYLLDEAALVRAEFDIDDQGRITARAEVVEKEITIFVAVE